MDSGVRARKRLRARRRARGGYLTLRAQKSLHSAGLPAAHLYWIPSSCISKLGRMNRGKTGDGGGQCVPRRSKSFCWLGCIRFCSTVVSPFTSDSFFSNRTFDWKLPARPAQRSADSATIIHERLKNNTTHRQSESRTSPSKLDDRRR